jgi:hypothetical protein
MIRVAVACLVLAGCNGTAERSTTTKTAAGAAAPIEPEPGVTNPGPPPERDCSLLQPAIERITATEIAEIKQTRPANVAPIVEAEVTAAAATLIAVLPRLCEADAWSGAYTACVSTAKVRDDARACSVHLTEPQQARLETEMKNGVGSNSKFGVPECDQWEALVLRMQSCDRFPQASRDAIKQAVDQAMAAWEQQAATTPEMRTSIAQACKTAVEGMKQSMTSLGCPL